MSECSAEVRLQVVHPVPAFLVFQKIFLKLYAGVLQKYFGIRAEWVDEVEILRRISIGIYDHDEYEKALAWVRENCKEGFDKNLGKNLPPVITKSKIVPADKDWEFIVKMTLIIRDILYGNGAMLDFGKSAGEHSSTA